MVTIAQAIKQTSRAQESATRREKEILDAESRAGRIRVGGSVAEQFKFGSELPRARREAKEQRSSLLAQIGVAKEELQTFQGKVTKRRFELERIQKKISDIEAVRRIVEGGKPVGPLSGESRRLLELIKKGEETRQLQKKQAELEAIPEGFVGISTLEGPALVPIGGADIFRPIQSLQTGGLLLQQDFGELKGIQQPSFTPLPGRKSFSTFVEQTARRASDILPTPFTGVALVSERGKKAQRTFRDVRAGILTGLVPRTKEEAIFTGVTLGAGLAIGSGLRIAGVGIRALGGTRALRFGELGLQAVGLGLGSLFAKETLEQATGRDLQIGIVPFSRTTFAKTKEVSALQSGVVLGTGLREAGVLGLGTIVGSRGTEALFSRARVFGKEFVPLESITVKEQFASAPPGTTGRQLQQQFREQRVVTRDVDKIIRLPREEPFDFGQVVSTGRGFPIGADITPGRVGVRAFTGSGSGPRGQEFAAFLGGSREPGPFFAPQLSKEFLKGGSGTTFFGLGGGLQQSGRPIAFSTIFRDVTRLPKGLLADVRRSGTIGFKKFATPEQQSIVSFRAEKQSPLEAVIGTRFELGGGEIEALGRAGTVFRRVRKSQFFSKKGGTSFLIEEVRPTGRVVEPQDLIKRVRGTALVKTPKGVLLTFAPEERAFILPGGGINPRELVSRGTAREFFEETGLKIRDLKFLGDVTGPIKRFGTRRQPSAGKPVKNPFRFVREQFKVFETTLASVKGLRPSTEVQRIAFFKPGSRLPITSTTRDILQLGGVRVGKRARVRPEGIEKQLGVKFIKQSELGPGEFTGRQISQLSRVGRVSESIISPRSLGALGLRRTSRGGRRRVSDSLSSISSFGRGVGRTIIPGIPGTPPPRRPPSRPPSRPPDFPPIRPIPGGPFDFPTFPFSPPKKPPRRERRPKGQKKRAKRKRFVGRLAPSFTAQILDIRGSLPKEITVGGQRFGVLPGRIRKIPI